MLLGTPADVMGEFRGTSEALWMRCSGNSQPHTELQQSSQEMNGACRGRWADSAEKQEKKPKMRCHILSLFFFSSSTAPPVVASNEALSFCSITKQSTGESLVSTFDFDSHLSRTFIFSLWMFSLLFPTYFFLLYSIKLLYLFDVKLQIIMWDSVGGDAALAKGSVPQSDHDWLVMIY